MLRLCLEITRANQYSYGLSVVTVFANAEKLLEPTYVLKYFQRVVIKVIQAKSVSNESKKASNSVQENTVYIII